MTGCSGQSAITGSGQMTGGSGSGQVIAGQKHCRKKTSYFDVWQMSQTIVSYLLIVDASGEERESQSRNPFGCQSRHRRRRRRCRCLRERRGRGRGGKGQVGSGFGVGPQDGRKFHAGLICLLLSDRLACCDPEKRIFYILK